MGNKRRARKEAGFTLIELLIVIIVLGILTAIVLMGLGTFRKTSEASACKADSKQLRTAETAYIARYTGDSADASTLKSMGYLQDVPDAEADGTGTALDVSATHAGVITVTPDCPS